MDSLDMPDSRFQRVPCDVGKCPRCGQAHKLFLRVQLHAKPEEAVPMFGGGAPRAATIAFTCPVTKDLFTIAVPHPLEGDIVGPDESGEDIPVADTAPPASGLQAEYAEWLKTSRATALNFCTTMLTTSTGAVPVYFAVLKYIGVEAVGGTVVSRIGILPPLLFLLSAVIFATALRPRLRSVREVDFAQFRASRLESLQRLMLSGLVVFAAGIVIAIALAGRLLRP